MDRAMAAAARDKRDAAEFARKAVADLAESFRRGTKTSGPSLEQARQLVVSTKEAATPAPDPAEAARKQWWDQFRSARADFRPGETPKPALGALLARAPLALGTETGELLQWFKDQAANGESPIADLEKKDRSLWPGLSGDARRLAQWARTMQSFLQGLPGDFPPAGEAFGKLSDRAERIASYPGMITLRIHVFPFAALRSMKSGDRCFIKDGKIEDPGFGAPVGTSLWSPLVIKRFEINDYELELAHPDLGVRKVSLRKSLMAHDGDYRLEGDMAAEGLIQLSKER
jgi:hypothetical protein